MPLVLPSTYRPELANPTDTGALTGRIDADALDMVWEELRSTGDRDAAIRQLAQLYGCHWDAAALLVSRVEKRYRRTQTWPWRQTLIILVSLLLCASLVYIALNIFLVR